MNSRLAHYGLRSHPSPQFLVSVDTKGFSFLVSPLDATLADAHVSVDSKGVRRASGAGKSASRQLLGKANPSGFHGTAIGKVQNQKGISWSEMSAL